MKIHVWAEMPMNECNVERTVDLGEDEDLKEGPLTNEEIAKAGAVRHDQLGLETRVLERSDDDPR